MSVPSSSQIIGRLSRSHLRRKGESASSLLMHTKVILAFAKVALACSGRLTGHLIALSSGGRGGLRSQAPRLAMSPSKAARSTCELMTADPVVQGFASSRPQVMIAIQMTIDTATRACAASGDRVPTSQCSTLRYGTV